MNRNERYERSQQRKKFAVSIFFVFLMVASTLAFVMSFQTAPQDFSYNEHAFAQRGNQWVTEVETPFGDKEYSFYYHPSQFNVNVPQDIVQAVKSSPEIVLVFNPNSTEVQYIDQARFELANYLALDLGKVVKHTVTMNTTQYSFPVETCGARNALYITFAEGNESRTAQENNCITIQSFSGIDYVQYSENIIYQLLGVME